ncbi:MAG: alpha/beta hydrolase [Candidatus Enterosoma sp.]|nr:alpha/beta hydrolase [bacterium]MDY3265111.1 alpha/beta hydrolase [Candidatus Enterosoma sp.]MDY4550165.1 alpha/beta hydrolase [Candidatus Enterosoma sp.]
MPWYWILLIVLGSLFVLFAVFTIVLSIIFLSVLSHPKRVTREVAFREGIKDGYFNKIEGMKREEFTLTMRDGYVIHLEKSIHPNSKGIVLFAHGYTWTREGMLKYAQEFYEMGYSVILYDERGHGDNKRVACTFGYNESKDQNEICDYIRKEYGKEVKLGLLGESLGAATTLLTMGKRDDLSFVVADCPYSSLNEFFVPLLKANKLPCFILPFSSLFCKLIHHYWFKDISPKDAIREKKTPLLLITGNNDNLIPCIESQWIYDNKKEGIKELYFMEGADHAMAYRQNPVKYREVLDAFLKRVEEEA